MGRACPSCKSERCGNHAACSRKREKNRERNIDMFVQETVALATELGQRRGYPLTLQETMALAEDFAKGLDAEIKKRKEEGTIV